MSSHPMLLPLSGLTGHTLSLHIERASCSIFRESVFRPVVVRSDAASHIREYLPWRPTSA